MPSLFPITSLNLQPLLWAVGWLIISVSSCLLLPIGLAYWNQEPILLGLSLSLSLSILCGGALVGAFRGAKMVQFRLREGFLLTVMSWIAVSLCASLPFYLSGHTQCFTDALFESVSSLTTTGISLFQKGYYAYEGLRFWRIFLQWIGGFGIILMAITLLPALKVGGSQLVQSEFSDRSEKIMPRTSQIASSLMLLYISLTVGIFGLLWLGNLSFFDALYYSMSALSTGGIVLGKTSALTLNPFCQSVLILAMVLGGSTLILLVVLAKGDWKKYWQDEQIRGYYRILLGASFLVVLSMWKHYPHPLLTGIFMTTSALTTTGFEPGTSLDSFLHLCFLVLSYMGGCSGSTAGGIKIFRMQILYRLTKNQLLSMIQPYRLFLTSYNKIPVEESAMTGLVTTMVCYLGGWIIFSLGYGFLGNSVLDSLTLSASILTNSGLSYGSSLVDTLSHLSEAEKWITIGGMLCGRFEFIALLGVLLIPFSNR